MRNVIKLAVPAALTMTLVAPIASAMDTYWESKPTNTAWVNSYGECWEGADGTANLAPCGGIIESLTIDLVNDEFEFDKSILTPDMMVALDDVARRVQESAGDEMLTIVGHTDSFGSDEYNLALGQRRADASKEYLVAQGVPADRMVTESAGERQPIAPNDTDANRGKNRRIEIRAEVFGENAQ